ncbi:phage head-tail joining protein [Mesorhizobium sp. A623]|jgi:hypothetical protein
MASLPTLVDYRERLYAARFSGTRSVQDSNGERIEYRSDAELARAIASINREIATAESELGCSRVRFQTSKGL